VLAAALTSCGRPQDNQPCFPSDVAPDLPWLSHQSLEWEIDAMAAIAGAATTDAPPSDTFVRAERDLKTEFWLDAAKELLAVARGDTNDGREVRQIAEYRLAIALYRLKYYAEAKRLFVAVASTRDHPMREGAHQWTLRRTCGG
jgi:hypothetical protein